MPLPVSQPLVVGYCGFLMSGSPPQYGVRQTGAILAVPLRIVRHIGEACEQCGNGSDYLAPQRQSQSSSHPLLWKRTLRDSIGATGQFTLVRYVDTGSDSGPTLDGALLTAIAKYIHFHMVKLLLPEVVPEALAKLTTREKEVLRWTAEGKTSKEIARILAISMETVNYHVKNATAKLVSVNKMQAVVKAATLGLLL